MNGSFDASASSFCIMGNNERTTMLPMSLHRHRKTSDDADHSTRVEDGSNELLSMKNDIDHSHDHSHDHTMPMMMSQGTIMFMDGFHSTLLPSSRTSAPPPCLNLFFPTWTLHTRFRFVWAMIGITFIGILVEACGVWRVKCLRRGRRCRRLRRWKRIQASRVREEEEQLHSVVPSTASASLPPPAIYHQLGCPQFIRRLWVQMRTKKIGIRYDLFAAFLHASRALFGYLLMLAVMTYSVEFLLCAVTGMVLGRYWLADAGGELSNGEGKISEIGLERGSEQQLSNNMSTITGVDTMNHDGLWGSGDPCCGIDEDDEDDDIHDMVRSTDLTEPLLLLSSDSNGRVVRRSLGCT